MARAKNTPNDPQRRERIVAATMRLLETGGIAAVTARAVAAQAEVPVGSVSYHFDSVRALLLEASRRVLELRRESLARWSHTVTSATVTPRLAELVHDQITTGRSLTVVSYELYVLGLRDEDFRAVSAHGSAALCEHLVQYLPTPEATRLAATADGLQLESLFADPPPTLAELSEILKA